MANSPSGQNAQAATVVRCEAGKIGASPAGVIEYVDVGIGGRETASVEYDVIWPTAMQWVRGGKLPGIYGGIRHSFNPANIPSGTDGFTVRPMWMAGGGAILYVWDMKAGPYGRGPHTPPAVFLPGRKQRVKLSITLNTPGRDDGRAAIDVDGRRVLQIADLKVRTTPYMKISGCFWCVFYGGADLSYAPTADQYITITKVIGS